MKCKLSIIFILFICSLSAQSINSVSPDYGNAGQTIPVTISGSNTFFTTANVGAFVFQQASNNNLSFPAYPNVTSNTEVNGDLELFWSGTSSLPFGFYNLRYSPSQGSAVTLNDAFFVNNSLGGTNTISGTIVSGTPKMLGEGDPMVFSKIFLQNSSTSEIKLVGRTNSNGYISFSDIPFGIYYLHLDNKSNLNPLRIVVDENSNTTDIQMVFKNGHIVLGLNDKLFIDNFNFNIYPTLFTDKLELTMNLKTVLDVFIEVVDSKGQVVFTQKKSNKMGKVDISLAEYFSGKSKGIYFLKTTINNQTLVTKLIKK